MIQEWFLIVTLISLLANGEVKEREVRNTKHTMVECQQMSEMYSSVLEPQLGNEIVEYGTGPSYRILLGGNFIGFTIACQGRERYDMTKWLRLDEMQIPRHGPAGLFGASRPKQDTTKKKKTVKF
jgi:hypothetical protein